MQIRMLSVVAKHKLTETYVTLHSVLLLIFSLGRFFGFVSGSERRQWRRRYLDYTRRCKASNRRNKEVNSARRQY